MSNETRAKIASLGLIVAGGGCGLVVWNHTNSTSVAVGLCTLAAGAIAVFWATSKHG